MNHEGTKNTKKKSFWFDLLPLFAFFASSWFKMDLLSRRSEVQSPINMNTTIAQIAIIITHREHR